MKGRSMERVFRKMCGTSMPSSATRQGRASTLSSRRELRYSSGGAHPPAEAARRQSWLRPQQSLHRCRTPLAAGRTSRRQGHRQQAAGTRRRTSRRRRPPAPAAPLRRTRRRTAAAEAPRSPARRSPRPRARRSAHGTAGAPSEREAGYARRPRPHGVPHHRATTHRSRYGAALGHGMRACAATYISATCVRSYDRATKPARAPESSAPDSRLVHSYTRKAPDAGLRRLFFRRALLVYCL